MRPFSLGGVRSKSFFILLLSSLLLFQPTCDKTIIEMFVCVVVLLIYDQDNNYIEFYSNLYNGESNGMIRATWHCFFFCANFRNQISDLIFFFRKFENSFSLCHWRTTTDSLRKSENDSIVHSSEDFLPNEIDEKTIFLFPLNFSEKNAKLCKIIVCTGIRRNQFKLILNAVVTAQCVMVLC